MLSNTTARTWRARELSSPNWIILFIVFIVLYYLFSKLNIVQSLPPLWLSLCVKIKMGSFFSCSVAQLFALSLFKRGCLNSGQREIFRCSWLSCSQITWDQIYDWPKWNNFSVMCILKASGLIINKPKSCTRSTP